MTAILHFHVSMLHVSNHKRFIRFSFLGNLRGMQKKIEISAQVEFSFRASLKNGTNFKKYIFLHEHTVS